MLFAVSQRDDVWALKQGWTWTQEAWRFCSDQTEGQWQDISIEDVGIGQIISCNDILLQSSQTGYDMYINMIYSHSGSFSPATLALRMSVCGEMAWNYPKGPHVEPYVRSYHVTATCFCFFGCYLYLSFARTCRLEKYSYVLEISIFRTDAMPTYGNRNTPCQGQKECSFQRGKTHLGFICGRISKAK